MHIFPIKSSACVTITLRFNLRAILFKSFFFSQEMEACFKPIGIRSFGFLFSFLSLDTLCLNTFILFTYYFYYHKKMKLWRDFSLVNCLLKQVGVRKFGKFTVQPYVQSLGLEGIFFLLWPFSVSCYLSLHMYTEA